jgi:hypothetical protein
MIVPQIFALTMGRDKRQSFFFEHIYYLEGYTTRKEKINTLALLWPE